MPTSDITATTIEVLCKKKKTFYEYVAVLVLYTIKGKRKPTRVEIMLSKYPQETKWYVDTKFTNSLPDFHHGEGSRSCMKAAAHSNLLSAIEAAEYTPDDSDHQRKIGSYE